jgi:hypothetical protein
LKLGVVNSNVGYIQAVNPWIGKPNLSLQPSGGNVGIGTSNPTSKLDVSGDAKALSFTMSSNGGNALICSSGSTGSFISLAQGANMFNAGSNWPFYGLGCSGNGAMHLHSYGGIIMGDYGNSQLHVKDNNVGVGKSNPTYKLDVSRGATRLDNAVIGSIGSFGSGYTGFQHSSLTSGQYALLHQDTCNTFLPLCYWNKPNDSV